MPDMASKAAESKEITQKKSNTDTHMRKRAKIGRKKDVSPSLDDLFDNIMVMIDGFSVASALNCRRVVAPEVVLGFNTS